LHFLGLVAPTKKPSIVILRETFAVKQMKLKKVQSDVQTNFLND